MSLTPSQSHVRAWISLVKASQRMLEAVEADIKAAGFPPLAWYDVLLELRRAEGGRLRPHAIEERLLIAQHNVSRLVDRLEKAGLAAREPCAQDGRGQDVVITGKGRDLLQAMWPVYAAAIRRHVAGRLDEAEAAQLSALLDKLLN